MVRRTSGRDKKWGACWLFLRLGLFLKSIKRVKMIFNVGGVNGSIWAYAKFSIFNEKIGHFTHIPPK